MIRSDDKYVWIESISLVKEGWDYPILEPVELFIPKFVDVLRRIFARVV